jgi:hypothetical protein
MTDTQWTTTMAAIRAHHPCTDGWTKLLKHTGLKPDDAETPVPLLTILESNGLDDALWCLRAVEGKDREIRLFAVWCARQVQHLMTDPRSTEALDVAERYANGQASDEELTAARAAAWDAAWAASDAARAASAARAAAWDAAWDAQEAKFREMVGMSVMPPSRQG